MFCQMPPHLHRVIVVLYEFVGLQRCGAAEVFIFFLYLNPGHLAFLCCENVTLCDDPMPYLLILLSIPFKNSLFRVGLGVFLISQVTGTDIYLICSLEGTGDISGRHGCSMLMWPEEKPMIICLCRLKTYVDNIFIHEHVFPQQIAVLATWREI